MPIFGQEVEGYIYDQDSRISGIRIENLSHDRVEVSNPNGYFRIEAKFGDTLQFSSMAYDPYELIVNQKQLERKIVVELKISSLEEVKINAYKPRAVAIQDLDKHLTYQVRKDAKKHPELYNPSSGNIGYIISSIINLFKSEKPVEVEISYLEFEDFEILFSKDKSINIDFLTTELGIPTKNHELFFDYLASQYITHSILEESERLALIELLYKHSADYHELIKNDDN